MSKVVSIVVPIYNVEKYLYRCVDSILNQSYQNLEVILVDDGSPDNCGKICDEYAVKDSRVKVIHKYNGGLSDARNYGLNYASGQYIIFIDSDDYIEKQLVERALGEIEKQDADVVIWGYFADFVDDNESLIDSQKRVPKKQVYDSKDSSFKVYSDLVGFIGYAWNKMYRTDYLKTNNFKFEKGLSLVEDIVFNSPALSNCKKVVFLNEAYVHYMQRPRDTLGTKYYSDFFELKKRALSAIDRLFEAWKVPVPIGNKIIANIGFSNINTALKMISQSSNKRELKRGLTQSIIEDNITIKVMKNYKPTSRKHFFLYYMIKWKQYKTINFLYNLKK